MTKTNHRLKNASLKTYKLIKMFKLFKKDTSFSEFISDVSSKLVVARDIATSVSSIIDKPTPAVIAKEVLSLAVLISKKDHEHPSNHFDNPAWGCFGFSFCDQMIELIKLRKEEIKLANNSDRSWHAYECTIFGERIGWLSSLNSKGHFIVDSVYYRTGRFEEFKGVIMKIFWEHFKGKPVVVHKSKIGYEDYLRINEDEIRVPYHSKRSEELAVYFKKCIGANVHRSILFYGPPGTGKTTLANTVVNALSLKSMRFRLRDVTEIDPSDVMFILKTFQPDVVIIDDIDHMPDSGQMLEILEMFKSVCKLTMATVNNRSALLDASTRPGRFDEFIEVLHLDFDVVKNVLGKKHEKYYDTIKDWPIVYIEELKTRLKFQDEDQAMASIRELQSRISKAKRFYDDSESEYRVEENSVDSALPVDG